MTSSPPETGHTVLNATRARQGRWGQHIFWVLVFGSLLAALGLFAAWTMNADEATEPTRAERAATAQTFDTPAPPPATPPSQ